MNNSYTWSDAVIITTEKGVIEFPTGIGIGNVQIRSKLYSRQAYGVSKTFVIPESISGGTFYVYVIPDYYKTFPCIELETLPIFDINKTVEVPVIPKPDLEIIYMDTIPEAVTSGETMILNFQVKNIGGSTRASSWTDAVIINEGTLMSSGSLKLLEIRHIGSLGYDSSYVVDTLVTFPLGITGSYNLYIQIDTQSSVEDDNRDNNIYSSPLPIEILPAPLPDITPSVSLLESSIRSGELFFLQLNITNIGQNDANGTIYNSVYLSSDTILDPFDHRFPTINTLLDVAVNRTQYVSLEVFMPFDIPSAGYYIIVDIDSRDDLYETSNRNNVAYTQVDIVETVSTDIVVDYVVSNPLTVKYSEDINVQWKLINNGSLDARGYKCDTTYLSVDDKWSIDDEKLGVTCSFLNLSGSGAHGKEYSLMTTIPLINPVSYNMIVRTRSNIRDLNLENNVGVAVTQTLVDIDKLIIDVPFTFLLRRFEQRVFRVRNVKAEETLVVSLRSNTSTDFNELYVKYGEIVTSGNYDATGQDFLVADQNTVISNSRAGDYYVLARNLGSILANEDSEFKSNVTVTVKYAELEILDVFPQSAAPYGITTLKISGTLFPEESNIFLASNLVTIESNEVFHFSSLEVYASFNLSGFSVGSSWFVQLIDRYDFNHQTTSQQLLRIIDGIPGTINMRLNRPGALRPQETASLSLFIQNIGNTDVYTPMVLLEIIGNATAQINRGSYVSQWDSVHSIYATPQEGPGGILPPGGYSQVSIDIIPETYDTENIQLRIIELKPSPNANHYYVDSKESLRPIDTGEISWDQIWMNFISYVGRTQFTLSKQLSSTANQLSLINRQPIDTESLVDYILDISDGVLSGTSLYDNTDLRVTYPYTGFNELVLYREISSLISDREYFSFFGRGWRVKYIDTKLERISTEYIELQMGYMLTSFSRVAHNLYELVSVGTIEKKSDEIVFADKRSSIISYYHFDNSSKQLQYIDNDLDKTRLTFVYEPISNLLQSIISTSGVRIEIVYNNADLVETVTMTSPETDDLLASYLYDIDYQFLISTNINGETTQYNYTDDGALKYVTYADGSIQRYLYDEKKLYSGSSRISGDGETESSLDLTQTGNGRVDSVHFPSKESTTVIFDENSNVGYVKSVGSLSYKFTRKDNVKTVYAGDQVLQMETYDTATGKLLEVDANEVQTSITYSANGDIVSVVDGNRNERTGTYEESQTVITYPDTTTETVTFDDNGYISRYESRSGKMTKFNYDESGNLVYKKIPEEEPTFYQYDKRSFVTHATNANGTIIIRYNDNGFPLSVTYPNGKQLNYEYERNLRIRLYDNEGYDIRYIYDKFDRLIRIVDQGVTQKELLQLKYDALQRVTERRTGNNCSTIYGYNAIDNKLESQLTLCPDTNRHQASLISEVYEFDKRNRLKILNTTKGVWRYGYDSASQLISWTDPTGKVTEIKYDDVGNRHILNVDGNSKAYTVNNLNEYKSYGKYETWTHDLNGNLVEVRSETMFGKIERYTFSDENRLTGLSSFGQDCSLEYDALGNLYQSTCNGQTTQFLVDPFGQFGGEILFEKTSDGIKKYIFAGVNGLVALMDGNQMFYYHFDRLGSTRVLTNEDGLAVNTYQYDPFGEIVSKTERINNFYTFVGKWGVRQLDGFTGLYYMRARVYDHRHGRFLSPNPLGINGRSYNYYVYLNNNPLSGIDPKGTVPVILVSAGVGGLIGVGTYVVGYVACDEPFDWSAATKSFVTGAAGRFFTKNSYMVSALKTGGGNNLEAYLKGIEINDDERARIIQGSLVAGVLSKVPFADMILKRSTIPTLGSITQKLFNKVFKKQADRIREFNKKTYSSYVESNVNKLVDYIKNLFKQKSEALGLLIDEVLEWLRSIDPNDMIGPAGYGEARFIPTNVHLTYKIRFENDINATAPAKHVQITTVLDDDLEERTVRIGDFGFGNFTNKVQPTGSYQKQIDFVNELGIYVKVDANVDYRKREIIWDIRAIDPETRDIPTDARMGFLPPNPENGTEGQGFVTFNVMPQDFIFDEAVIDAKASIIFDENYPIDTPPIFNTIDSGNPEVNVTVDADLISSGILVIHIDANDEGSGVSFVDIYTNRSEGKEILVARSTDRVVTLNVPAGVTYNIIAIPRDNVGNLPSDTEIQKNIVSVDFPVIVSCVALNNCSGFGVCTGQNLCSCDSDRYGLDCNSVETPVEPPIVEVQSAEVDEDSQVTLAVTVMPYMPTYSNQTTLIIKGAPHESFFSHGTKQSDEWNIPLQHLSELMFYPPPDTDGTINLILFATTKSDHYEDAVRIVNLPVHIKAVADAPAINISSPCYFKNQTQLTLTFSAVSTDMDGSEDITNIILSNIPSDVIVVEGIPLSNNTYELEGSTTEIQLRAISTFEGLNVINITVINRESSNGHETSVSKQHHIYSCGDVEATIQHNSDESSSLTYPLLGVGMFVCLIVIIMVLIFLRKKQTTR